MTNKTISDLFFASLGLIFVVAVFENAMSVEVVGGLYMLFGWNLIVWGVLACLRLRKQQ